MQAEKFKEIHSKYNFDFKYDAPNMEQFESFLYSLEEIDADHLKYFNNRYIYDGKIVWRNW